jgi:anthranilate phosphoribosyltransferase
LAERRLTYLPVEVVNPRLQEILSLKSLLGVRSPLNTVVRHLNPFDARTSLISVFHPNYRAIHRDAARLMGVRNLACFKGEGGEAERRPEKPCLVEGLRDGAAFSEEWPARPPAGPRADLGMEPRLLPALWKGELHDPHAEATVIATAALALRQLGRAEGMDQALELAARQWHGRRR